MSEATTFVVADAVRAMREDGKTWGEVRLAIAHASGLTYTNAQLLTIYRTGKEPETRRAKRQSWELPANGMDGFGVHKKEPAPEKPTPLEQPPLTVALIFCDGKLYQGDPYLNHAMTHAEGMARRYTGSKWEVVLARMDVIEETRVHIK